MIWAEDTQIAVDGEYLPGLFKSIEITGDALIEEQEIEGSSRKKKQAQGYEDAKITIELTLEDGNIESKEEKLQEVQNLFKKTGQEKPIAHTIISKHLASRGISKVLLKSLVSREDNAKTKISVTLTLIEYNPMTVTATTTSGSGASKSETKSATKKNTAATTKTTSRAPSSYQRGAAPKLTSGEKSTQSPAADTKDSNSAVKNVRRHRK